MAMHKIEPAAIPDNMVKAIGTDWGLLTAGDENSCNTMTISWGQVGVLWNLPVATIYIRPSRYTLDFVEKTGRYSVSFLDPKQYRKQQNLLGTKSGRDGDKITEAGLTVTLLDGVPAFEEAHLVLVCRTLHWQDLDPAGFVDPSLDERHYPGKDYHRIFIGQIEAAYLNE